MPRLFFVFRMGERKIIDNIVNRRRALSRFPEGPGGARLARAPEEISFFDIYSAVMEQEMLDFVRDYNVDAKPEKIFSLEQVPDAHRYLESSDSYGKVVCVVASCV